MIPKKCEKVLTPWFQRRIISVANYVSPQAEGAMPTETSTGKVKNSLVLDMETYSILQEFKRVTGTSRSAAVRDLIRRGWREWQREQKLLEGLRSITV